MRILLQSAALTRRTRHLKSGILRTAERTAGLEGTMRLPTQETAKPIVDRFEDLSAAYRLECEQGIPMSVHERYEQRLARLRRELRSRGTSCRLGDVLKRMGSLDDERLADALSIQRASGGKKLIGEILIELGWVDEPTVRRAVTAQARLAAGA